MNKFLFSFLILLSHNSYGQVEELYPNVLRDSAGIVQCIVTRNGVDTDEIHYFDNKGRDTAVAYFLKNKIYKRDEHHYGNKGLITSFMRYGGEIWKGDSTEWDVDLLVSKKEYLYKDRKLVMVNEDNFLSEGMGISYKYILSYRQDGKLIKKMCINLPQENVSYGYNDKKGKYHQQNSDTTIYKYLYKGTMMSIDIYSWGMLLNTEKRTFSKNGLLLVGKYIDVTKKVIETKEYKYDKAGRMTEEVVIRPGKTSRTSILYASSGAPIEKQYFSNNTLKLKVRYNYIK